MSGLGGRLLLSLAAIVASVLLFEGIARVLFDRPARGNMTPVPTSLLTRNAIPGVPFALRPKGSVVHEFPSDPRGYFDPGPSLTYRVNSLGFRGEETVRKKPAGTFRVVGLGDSFTFGTGVRRQDTYLSVLERQLREGDSNGSYEVLNLGVMGYNTPDELQMLRHRGLAYQPDLVVLGFFLNDVGIISGPHTVRDHLNVGRASGFLPAWARGSVLLDRLDWLLVRSGKEEELVSSHRAAFRPDRPGWQRAQRSFERMGELAELHGFDLALVIFPVLWQLSEGYPFTAIHEQVRAAAESAGFRVLDLRTVYEDFEGPELWVHPTNQHPNEVGHEVAGDALFGFLVEEGLVLAR